MTTAFRPSRRARVAGRAAVCSTCWRPLCGIFALGLALAATLAAPDAAAQGEPPTHLAAPGEAEEVDEAAKIVEPAGDEVIAWLIEPATGARGGEASADAFRDAVAQALAAEAGRHLLSEEQFRAWVAERSGPAPTCFKGLEPCVAPRTQVFDLLDLSSLIRVRVDRGASGVTADYEVVDRRGQVVRAALLDARNPRELAFAVVREIFDATGSVLIESDPAGASVQIDGVTVGTTPLSTRLSVGAHDYTLRLPDRTPLTESVEVVSGGSTRVSHSLALLPGVLLVQDAPPNAQILINGEPAGRAGDPIELPPGNYTLEVRAEGHEAMRDAVTVAPGAEIRRSAPLEPSSVFASDITPEAIKLNNYALRLGYEFGYQSATFQDARTDDELPYEFQGFVDDNGILPADRILREGVTTNGLRLDAGISADNFGLVLLSLSYRASSTDLDAVLTRPDGARFDATVTSVQRLSLRPFQIYYRYFFDNIAPFVEGGIGIDFQWLELESRGGSDLPAPLQLTRSEAFWTLGLGGQYYFTSNFFAQARYSLQDYFDSGSGVDHLFQIGLGAAFPNVFGFETEPPEKL